MLKIMPRPERAERGIYGETKKPKQFMLTEHASDLLDEIADSLGITRSEVLERAIRCGGLEAARDFNSEAEEAISS